MEGQIHQLRATLLHSTKYDETKERTHSTDSRWRVSGPCYTAGSALLRQNERHCSPDGGNKQGEERQKRVTLQMSQRNIKIVELTKYAWDLDLTTLEIKKREIFALYVSEQQGIGE